MSKEYLSKTGALYIVTKVKDLINQAKITVDTALSATSTNPVQNKVVNTALDTKAPLAGPTFTGVPKAPTAAVGNNTTQIATTAFVAAAITNAIGNVNGFSIEKVDSLPSTGATGKIYLLANGGSESQNACDEYIWDGAKFEKIGTTAVDLTGYMKSTDLVEVTNTEIDAMFA